MYTCTETNTHENTHTHTKFVCVCVCDLLFDAQLSHIIGPGGRPHTRTAAHVRDRRRGDGVEPEVGPEPGVHLATTVTLLCERWFNIFQDL